MKLLIIRPEPGAMASAKRAIAAGMDGILLPFFTVEPRLWDVPDAADFDALLLTSANAVRLGGDTLSHIKPLPVHAVGQHTANAAQMAGFAVVSTGDAGIENALENAGRCGHHRLLWLAGEDRREPEIGPGVELVTRIVYASEPRNLPADAAAVLGSVDMVALHSARAANRLAQTVDRLGVDRATVLLAAFSPAIAAEAGPGWRGVGVAAEPNDSALLSAAAELGKQHGLVIARKAQQ
jgi:uroporphyrinogen-III synthase